MTTAAAKRSTRPLPIIFATLDPTVPRSVPIPQSLADELVSYTQWALQFSAHSRDEIRDTFFCNVFIGFDQTLDYGLIVGLEMSARNDAAAAAVMVAVASTKMAQVVVIRRLKTTRIPHPSGTET